MENFCPELKTFLYRSEIQDLIRSENYDQLFTEIKKDFVNNLRHSVSKELCGILKSVDPNIINKITYLPSGFFCYLNQEVLDLTETKLEILGPCSFRSCIINQIKLPSTFKNTYFTVFDGGCDIGQFYIDIDPQKEQILNVFSSLPLAPYQIIKFKNTDIFGKYVPGEGYRLFNGEGKVIW